MPHSIPYRPCPLQLRPPTIADYLLALPWRRLTCLATVVTLGGPFVVDHIRFYYPHCTPTNWAACRGGQ